MLMTTKNGKAIARVIAIAICALMLVAFGASCSDEAAARAEEAYNAALKAEQAAKDADQAAKDAQNSADEALKEAENAGKNADEKLTEDEIVKLLEKYVDSDKLKAELGKYVDTEKLTAELANLLSEDSVKALITADVTAAKTEVLAKVDEILAKHGCAGIAELKDKVAALAEDVLEQYDAIADNNEAALEALLALIETKRAKVAEVKASLAYGDAAVVAINEAFEVAQVKILCANTAEEITAANTEFAAALADLPSVVDELYARIAALEGNVMIAVPGYYADSSVNEIVALEAIVNLLDNDSTLADLKAEMEDYDDVAEGEEADLSERVEALRADYTNLDRALAAAEDVNAAIDALKGYAELKYVQVTVADGTGLNTKVATAVSAVDAWIDTYFADDEENENINRILYNRVKLLKNDEGIEADFANVESAAEYAEYVTNLPTKYTAAIATALNATDWAKGYVFAGDYEALNALYTAYLAEDAKFEFVATTLDVPADEDTDSTNDVFAAAWNYSAYANYLKGIYNAEGSTVKAAVEALAALNGKLSINDINATENNKFTAYENAFTAWTGTDVPTFANGEIAFTEVALAKVVLDDILTADIATARDAVLARKAVLQDAEDAAEKINLGGIYTYYVKATEYVADTKYYASNGAAFEEATVADAAAFAAGEYYTAIEINGGNGIDQYFDIADGVWTLKTTITYRDIVELRRLAEQRALWAATFAIEIPAEGAEQYVADNYAMIKNAELAEATAKAKTLVDEIINAEATKALAQAIANLNKVSANGEDYENLYVYTAVAKALEAFYDWEEAMGHDAIDTSDIDEFKEAGLENIYGNLMIAHSKAEETYNNAVADYTKALYTAFGADFNIDNYNPTVYDKFVRDAWAEAKAWVDTYLVDESFTSVEDLFNVDDLGLLTSAVYANVKAANTKYDAYINAALAELNAINANVAKYATLNLITDKQATTVDIPKSYTDWVAKYLNDDATDPADVRLTYSATKTAVDTLSAAYTTLYNNAAAAWAADVAAKIEALENAVADLYSSVDSDDALYQARAAYDAWATTYLAGVKTSAAYENFVAGDEKIDEYKAGFDAIDALEKDVADLAEEYEGVRDALIADINKLPETITSDVAATVDGLRDRYDDWAESLVEALEDPAVYNTAEIKAALLKLVAAENKLAAIKEKLEAVEDALAALPASPDTFVADVDYDSKAQAYADAVAALKTAVDAYLAENSMTALVAGDDTAYELEAAQVKAINTAYKLSESIAAIKMAQTLYVEYEAELAGTEYTAEEKLNRSAALVTTRTVLVNNIVNDASDADGDGEYKATAADKVETIGRVRMAAILSASGTIAEPELDDTWEDLENWGPANNG